MALGCSRSTISNAFFISVGENKTISKAITTTFLGYANVIGSSHACNRNDHAVAIPDQRKTIVWVRCLENNQLVITSGFPTVNFRK